MLSQENLEQYKEVESIIINSFNDLGYCKICNRIEFNSCCNKDIPNRSENLSIFGFPVENSDNMDLNQSRITQFGKGSNFNSKNINEDGTPNYLHNACRYLTNQGCELKELNNFIKKQGFVILIQKEFIPFF